MPNATHKNAGVIVIAAEKVRNAVIIPTIILATIESPMQSPLHLQLELVIIISPPL